MASKGARKPTQQQPQGLQKDLRRKGAALQKTPTKDASSVVHETPAVKNLGRPVSQKRSSLMQGKDHSMEAAMEKITKAAAKHAVQTQIKRLHSSSNENSDHQHRTIISARELILNRLGDDMPPLQKAQAKAAEIRMKYDHKIKSVQVQSTW